MNSSRKLTRAGAEARLEIQGERKDVRVREETEKRWECVKKLLLVMPEQPEIETLAHGFLEIRLGMSSCESTPQCLVSWQEP